MKKMKQNDDYQMSVWRMVRQDSWYIRYLGNNNNWKKANANAQHSATRRILQQQRRCASHTGQCIAKTTTLARTHGIWHAAIQPSQPFNGLHLHNLHVNYYSFTDPGRMEGWVGLVCWPIANSLPTEWSPVNYRLGARQEKSAGQGPTS